VSGATAERTDAAPADPLDALRRQQPLWHEPRQIHGHVDVKSVEQGTRLVEPQVPGPEMRHEQIDRPDS
jgi:hypothetical protein